MCMSYGKHVGVHRISNGSSFIDKDILAFESLLQLHVNDEPITSLLGTPRQLKQLYVGHLYSEGYGDFHQTNITVSHEDELLYKIYGHGELTKDTNLPTLVTTSCGACDGENLLELNEGIQHYIQPHLEYNHNELFAALRDMKSSQQGFQQTGGMHAAALWNHEEGLQCLSEDIGRHNAVDKSIGQGLISQIDFSKQFLLLSGRCGWDIVAKAARSGIGSIVSIGACSSLAADTARELGLRIFSFMKQDSCVIIGALTHFTNENP